MPKLVIIYGTGMGNTEMMARAVEEGAKSAGVDIVFKKLDIAKLDDYLKDIADADAIILGSPTYNRKMMMAMKRLIDSAEKLDLKGKVGTAFGSYGYSGEAVIDMNNKMKSYGMKVIEPGLRWKRIPDEEGLKKCRKLGKTIADMII